MWAFVMTSEEMAEAKEGTAIEAAMTTKQIKILQFLCCL
jgi:TusA-related sulfurtransferase